MQEAPAWELSKENVLPVKQGRSTRDLAAVLSADKPSLVQERARVKQQFEDALADPSRLENPLSMWRDYIEWVKAAYPAGGSEAGLVPLLERAVRSLMDDPRYKNDQTYVALWVAYADAIPEPAEVFKFMYGRGIGLDVALLYIAWAWAAEHAGNYAFAEKVYARGIARRALPLDRLQSRQKEFHRRAAKKWTSLGGPSGSNGAGGGGWDPRAPVDLDALTAHMQKLVTAAAAAQGSSRGGPGNENAGARHALTSITAAAAARSHRPAAEADLHAAVAESVATAAPSLPIGAGAARPYGYFGTAAPAPVAPGAVASSVQRAGTFPLPGAASGQAAQRSANVRPVISVFTDAEFSGPQSATGPARHDELGPRSAAAAAAAAPLPGGGAAAVARPPTSGSVTGAAGPASLIPAAGAAGWRDYGTEAGRRKENSAAPSAWTAPDAPLPVYAGTWEAPAALRPTGVRAPASAVSDGRIAVFVDDALAPPAKAARPTPAPVAATQPFQPLSTAAPSVAATPGPRGGYTAATAPAAPAAIAAFFSSPAAPARAFAAPQPAPAPAAEEEEGDASGPSFEELRAEAWKAANPDALKRAAAVRAAMAQHFAAAAAAPGGTAFTAAAAAPGVRGDVTVSASDIFRLLSDSTVGSEEEEEDTAMAGPTGARSAPHHQPLQSGPFTASQGPYGGPLTARPAAPPTHEPSSSSFAVYEDTSLGPAGAAVVFDDEEEAAGQQRGYHRGAAPAQPPVYQHDPENAGVARTAVKAARGGEAGPAATTGTRRAFAAVALPEPTPAVPATPGPSSAASSSSGPARILFRTAPRPAPGTLAYAAIREEALGEDGDEESPAGYSGGDDDVTLHTRLAMEDVNDLFASPSASPAAPVTRPPQPAQQQQAWGAPVAPVTAPAASSRPVPPDARRMSVNMAAAARRRSVMPAGVVAPSLRAPVVAVPAAPAPAATSPGNSRASGWNENAEPGSRGPVPGLLPPPPLPQQLWERTQARAPLAGLSYTGPAHLAQATVHAGFPQAPPVEGAFVPAAQAVLVSGGTVHPHHASGWTRPPASSFSVFVDPDNLL